MKDIALISVLIKYKAKYGNVYFVELPVKIKTEKRNILYIARPPSVNEIENWQATVDNLKLNDVGSASVVGYMCFEAAYDRIKPESGSEYYRKIDEPYFDDSIAYDLGLTVLENTPITFEDIDKQLKEEMRISAAGMIAYDIATLTGQPVNDLKNMSTEVILKLYDFIIKSTGKQSVFERLNMGSQKSVEPPKEAEFSTKDLTENFDKVQEKFNEFLRGVESGEDN